MQKLIPVEQAKTLFNEAKGWSVWRWLAEKKRVRGTADRAWDALEELEAKVKASWSDELKKAYAEVEAGESLNGDLRANRRYEEAKLQAKDVDHAIKRVARHIREADNEAYNARMDAEDKFDEAEKHLSPAMARQGANMAINAWELTEKAIRKAEAAAREKTKEAS